MTTELTRGQIEDRIREKAMKDAEYRKKLMQDPKSVLSQEIDQNIPEKMEVKILEEAPNVIYLVAPQRAVQAGDELSEDQLEAVAGGFMDDKIQECHARSELSFASKIEIGSL